MRAIQRYREQQTAIAKSPTEAQMEEERMRDILLLLDSLFRREETTAKLILNCLYDIGSVNWVNNKFRTRPANWLMKWIARLTKPAFRMFALRWMKQNCPELIAKWMHSKVTFEQPQNTPEAAVVEAETAQENTSQDLESCTREIVRLRSQVRTLTALLIGMTVSLGSAVAWTVWKDQSKLQSVTHPRSVITKRAE
ncbi:hypothetical protein [Leptothermofonsia sp. ETS-13]|uniref:hypothetical protein n=1 Tax=Leptothermofonsia sp. ETS-13 TaxID=3035696 RepID=UPI003B9FCA9F